MSEDTLNIARCPEHGLHGERSEAQVRQLEVELETARLWIGLAVAEMTTAQLAVVQSSLSPQPEEQP